MTMITKFNQHYLIILVATLLIIASSVCIYSARQPEQEQPTNWSHPKPFRQNRSTAPYLKKGTGPLFHKPWFRNELGSAMDRIGATVGVELGVKMGEFSEQLLNGWRRCRQLYLVDSWRKLDNYVDLANVDDMQHLRFMFDARNRLTRFADKVSLLFLPMFTSEAAELVPSDLDFVYIDARHDYCGVAEDIFLWWPKIHSGGVMAGHDYLTAAEARALIPWQDWSICGNGSVIAGAVKQAVNDFAAREGGLHIEVSNEEWPTWLIRKP
jgi:hypothetical protein